MLIIILIKLITRIILLLQLIIIINSLSNEININKSLLQLESNKISNLIYNRYELFRFPYNQFFFGVSNINSNAWEILKYKFLIKLTYNKNKMNINDNNKGNKVDKYNNNNFLMIFGGSSVTAGHDSYFNESYPIVFNNRLQKIFSLLNINLIVENIAQGSNQCIPSELCYNSMGSESADFIGWEQSFNCGRESSMFELIARIASFQDAVVHYSASGSEAVGGCAVDKVFLFYFIFIIFYYCNDIILKF